MSVASIGGNVGDVLSEDAVADHGDEAVGRGGRFVLHQAGLHQRTLEIENQ